MRVAVVGGGIGGLSAAVAFQHRGVDVRVYEAAPEIQPVGKGIWLPTNAMLVLDRLGLGDTVAAKGLALERVEVHDKTGGLLQAVDLAAVRERYGRTTVSILRADLQAALVAALEDGTLHLGKRCAGVRHDEGGAAVVFEDGAEITADVVVGADGLRSRVREAVAPGVPLRYAGQTCYLGVADLALPPPEVSRVREIWGARDRFGYSAVGRDRVYWFAPRTARADRPLPTDVMDVLLSAYGDFPPPVADIIEHTPAGDITKLDLHDIEPLERWHRGRVVLVGDAAHAMTPNLGQGGAQAIEDAYALAQALHQSSTPDSAFERYEQLRQPRATRIARTAWWYGKVAHLGSPWLRRVRNTVLRRVPERVNRRQLDALYRLDF